MGWYIPLYAHHQGPVEKAPHIIAIHDSLLHLQGEIHCTEYLPSCFCHYLIYVPMNPQRSPLVVQMIWAPIFRHVDGQPQFSRTGNARIQCRGIHWPVKMGLSIWCTQTAYAYQSKSTMISAGFLVVCVRKKPITGRVYCVHHGCAPYIRHRHFVFTRTQLMPI